MKHFTLLFTFVNLFALSACGLNTKFDDDDYRPVGASTPLNSKTHTISETRTVVIEEKSNSSIDSGSTRYVKPGTEAPNTPVLATTKTVTPAATKKTLSTKNNNTITQVINNVFNSRYGESSTIVKIAKTVAIHCDKKNSPSKANNEVQTNICQYQFPEHCGAHAFSLINNSKSQLLIFHASRYQRNIIDTMSGNPQSAPGLWDKDDYVSSELLTVKQLINSNKADINSLGWIMNASDNEKAQLGRTYESAIKDSRKCF